MQPTQFLASLEKNRKSGSTGTINGNNPFCHTQAVADAVDILTLFAWHSGVPYMLMDSLARNGNSLPRRTACSECVGLVHWAEWQGPQPLMDQSGALSLDGRAQ